MTCRVLISNSSYCGGALAAAAQQTATRQIVPGTSQLQQNLRIGLLLSLIPRRRPAIQLRPILLKPGNNSLPLRPHNPVRKRLCNIRLRRLGSNQDVRRVEQRVVERVGGLLPDCCLAG